MTFMDHDMQTSPIAAVINGQPAIIGSGKMGVVYAHECPDRQADLEDACR